MPNQITDISWTSLWRIALFSMFVMLVYFSRQILLALFFAVVISAGLESVVNFFERHGVPRLLGTILVFVLIIFLAVLIIYIAIPILVIQLSNFFLNFSKLGKFFGATLSPRLIEIVNGFISEIFKWFFQGTFSLLTNASEIFSGVSLFLFVLFSSFYLTLSRGGLERFIIAVFPASIEGMALKIYKRVNQKLSNWLKAQFILSVILGTLVFLSLTLLGIKYALLLSVLAAIFELVPFVGPILSGSLSVLVALSASPLLAFYVLIVFVAIQELEGHVLVPILMNRAISLHPVIILFALMVGFEIAGILGLVIAIPVAVLIQEIIEELSAKKQLEPQVKV